MEIAIEPSATNHQYERTHERTNDSTRCDATQCNAMRRLDILLWLPAFVCLP
jgi:hypothetical protein